MQAEDGAYIEYRPVRCIYCMKTDETMVRVAEFGSLGKARYICVPCMVQEHGYRRTLPQTYRQNGLCIERVTVAVIAPAIEREGPIKL